MAKVKQDQPNQENSESSPSSNPKRPILAYTLFFFWNHPYIKVLIPAFATICCVMAELISIVVGLGLPAIIFAIQAISMMIRKKEQISFWSIAAFSEHLRETKLFRVSSLILHCYLLVCIGLWVRAQVATQEELVELGFPFNEMGNTWALLMGIFTTVTATYDLLTYDGAFKKEGKNRSPVSLEIGLFSDLIKKSEQNPALLRLKLKKVEYKDKWAGWILWPNYLLFKLFNETEYEWWTDSQSFISNARLITALKLLRPQTSMSELKEFYSDVDWDIAGDDLTNGDYEDLKAYFGFDLDGRSFFKSISVNILFFIIQNYDRKD